MNIRPAVTGDAVALTDLHLDVWDEAYADLISADVLRDRRKTRSERIRRWRSALLNDPATTLVAPEEASDRLLGFVTAGPGREPPARRPAALEVMGLYIRKEMYGQGLGHALLQAVIDDRAAYLWILEGNERASRFYRRQGFRYDGVSKAARVGVEHRMVRQRIPAVSPADELHMASGASDRRPPGCR
ncbi:GNAT family N-acetyltransferase [Nocardioides KLBMP 9356]|uniref:GNAT family N-acetyltransferase n=1 Tax=Nocardioides potassii TaxID=2911371 RepID=A0ABS9HAA9_9ACTN|nr:GNAT family N-acetyltransferase [Nocardioides potassii]MCF6378152.1 GNAT family N-acetyltransferase [Nocardioides potassii]